MSDASTKLQNRIRKFQHEVDECFGRTLSASMPQCCCAGRFGHWRSKQRLPVWQPRPKSHPTTRSSES